MNFPDQKKGSVKKKVQHILPKSHTACAYAYIQYNRTQKDK
jgi:hypothetical protein